MDTILHLPDNTSLENGKYKIIRFIASGGFGCTYEAVHTLLGYRYAIKEFFWGDFCNRGSDNTVSVGTKSKEADFNKLKKRFIKEATFLFKMHHPNIVHVSDVFEENGTAYYVMDYVEGRSLADMTQKGAKLEEEEALDYILQVCSALKYIHSQNMLHLDIKPSNIMVDKNGKTILIDFGASKHYNEQTGEQSSALLGIHSKPYSPIEQIKCEFNKFTPAVDIYALGATFYKILTGITPPPTLDLLTRSKTLQPLPSNISEATRKAVQSAMQFYTEQRPQTIEEFESLLNRRTAIIEEDVTTFDISDEEEVTNYGDKKAKRNQVDKKNEAKPVPAVKAKPKTASSSQSSSSQSSPKPNQEKQENPIPDTGIIDGHEYVDLGLPSGLLWATCNVGASKPEEYGDYFAWGETKTKSSYKEGNSETQGKAGKWYQKKIEKDFDWLLQNGYIGENGNLTLSHDAAHQRWGGSWRLPTEEEIKELLDNTTTEWVSYKEVYGYLVMSKINRKVIFLPAAGFRYLFSLNASGKAGNYWSSTPNDGKSNSAWGLYFYTRRFYSDVTSRDHGRSVRPVSDGKVKISPTPKVQSAQVSNQNLKKTCADSPCTINGHEYVDLGLPSGLKWATCNVGASSPLQYGSYYSWGEIRTKSSYDEKNSETSNRDKNWLFSNAYIDERGILTLSHDPANYNWGGSWRLPTQAEFEELIKHTNTEWITRHGIKGCLIKSKKNENSIFLPASGFREGSKLGPRGSNGEYWSSTHAISGIVEGLAFSPNFFRCQWLGCSYGRSVRPVSE